MKEKVGFRTKIMSSTEVMLILGVPVKEILIGYGARGSYFINVQKNSAEHRYAKLKKKDNIMIKKPQQ